MEWVGKTEYLTLILCAELIYLQESDGAEVKETKISLTILLKVLMV